MLPSISEYSHNKGLFVNTKSLQDMGTIVQTRSANGVIGYLHLITKFETHQATWFGYAMFFVASCTSRAIKQTQIVRSRDGDVSNTLQVLIRQYSEEGGATSNNANAAKFLFLFPHCRSVMRMQLGPLQIMSMSSLMMSCIVGTFVARSSSGTKST